jgi:hypothetical protein
MGFETIVGRAAACSRAADAALSAATAAAAAGAGAIAGVPADDVLVYGFAVANWPGRLAGDTVSRFAGTLTGENRSAAAGDRRPRGSIRRASERDGDGMRDCGSFERPVGAMSSPTNEIPATTAATRPARSTAREEGKRYPTRLICRVNRHHPDMVELTARLVRGRF